MTGCTRIKIILTCLLIPLFALCALIFWKAKEKQVKDRYGHTRSLD